MSRHQLGTFEALGIVDGRLERERSQRPDAGGRSEELAERIGPARSSALSSLRTWMRISSRAASNGSMAGSIIGSCSHSSRTRSPELVAVDATQLQPLRPQ